MDILRQDTNGAGATDVPEEAVEGLEEGELFVRTAEDAGQVPQDASTMETTSEILVPDPEQDLAGGGCLLYTSPSPRDS